MDGHLRPALLGRLRQRVDLTRCRTSRLHQNEDDTIRSTVSVQDWNEQFIPFPCRLCARRAHLLQSRLMTTYYVTEVPSTPQHTFSKHSHRRGQGHGMQGLIYWCLRSPSTQTGA